MSSPPVEKALLQFTRGVILLVPLVALILGGELFFPEVMYPAVAWKSFTFRFLIEVATGSWVLLAVANPRYRPRFSWVLLAMTVFLATLALANVLGANPYRSMWGNLERMDGWVESAHLFALFVVASSVLDTNRLWSLFFHVCLAVCTIVCGFAIAQLFGARLLFQFQQGVGDFRFDARLGNPVFLGMYLLLHVFLAALYGLRATGPRRLGYWLLVALFLSVLAGTGTRAAQVGVVVGATLVATLMAFRHPDPTARRRARILVVSLAAAAAIGFVLLKLDLSVLRNVTFIRRLDEYWASQRTRQLTWAIACDGFAQYPVLGWGQGNFPYVFDRYFQPALFRRSMWGDNAHNLVLQQLITGGVVGLTAYLAIWVSGLRALWSRRITTMSVADRSMLTGMATAYAIYATIQPEVLSGHIVLVAILAFLHTLVTEHRTAASTALADRTKRIMIGAPVVLVAVWALHDFVNVRNWRAAIALTDGQLNPITIDKRDGTAQLTFRRAMSLDSFGRTEAWQQLVDLYSAWEHQKVKPPGGAAGARQFNNIKQQARQLAIEEMRDQVAADPDNVRTRFYAGKLLNAARRPRQALVHLQHGVDLAPKRQILLLQARYSYQQLDQPGRALDMTRSVFQLFHPHEETRILYAVDAIHAESRADEDRALLRLHFDPRKKPSEPDQRVVRALVETKRFGPLVKIYERLLAPTRDGLSSGNIALDVARRRYIALGRAYAMAGRKEDAIGIYTELMTLDRSFRDRGTKLIERLQ